jgi:hypothetical protein
MADQTESRIHVAASPDAVMAVIADLAAYPEWNEEMKTVEVISRHGDGRPHHVRFVLDASPIKDDYVLAYTWAGDRAVHWSLVRAEMLAAMDGTYELHEAGDGTDVVYRLAVDLKIPMIGLLKRKGEKVVIDRALKGLKKRVEA